MGTFRINGPNGEEFEIEAPDDATEDQIMAYVQEEGLKAKPQLDPGVVASSLVGLRQGASFGLADEIDGAVMAGVGKLMGSDRSLSELYESGRNISRTVNKAASEQHPIPYYGGQIAGGVAPAVVSAGAGAVPSAARAGLAARSAAGASEGAVYGGLHGFGGAEGGVAERAKGAGIGAASGAVGGALMPGVMDVAGSVVRGVAAPIQGVLNPTRFGQQKAAEALMRDRNPAGYAGRGPQRASDDLARLRGQTGKDLMLADMGGENTRNLLRSAANMANTGAQRLNRTLDGATRQGGQWRRIERDMARGLGSPDDFAASIDQIVAERDLLAKPLFDRAFQVQVKPTEQLIEVVQRPGMQDILRRAAAKMQNEGADVSGAPPMVLFHRAKMEIDQAISQIKAGDTNTANWDVRTLTKMKHDLLDAIDNPAYRDALKVSAGDNALKSAARDGFDEALTLPTEDLARKMRSFRNASEADMYRMGASRALASKIRSGNVTRDRTENVFSSPDIQLRLRAIFPDGRSLREFQRDLIVEARMADTRKAVQGGPTTAKQLAQGDEAGKAASMIGAAANVATGRMEPVLNALARAGNRFTGLTPSTANSVINALMTRGGDDVAGEMRRAMSRAYNQPDRQAAASRTFNALYNATLAARDDDR